MTHWGSKTHQRRASNSATTPTAIATHPPLVPYLSPLSLPSFAPGALSRPGPRTGGGKSNLARRWGENGEVLRSSKPICHTSLRFRSPPTAYVLAAPLAIVRPRRERRWTGVLGMSLQDRKQDPLGARQ